MSSTISKPLDYLTVEPTLPHSASVIFVHGLGDSGKGFEPVAEAFGKEPGLRHVRWILPHAHPIPVTANQSQPTRSWFDILSFGFKEEEDEAGMQRSSKALKHLIESEMSTTGLDCSRIVIGGFSQGGAMAILTAMTLDRKLGGVAVLSGYVPLRQKFKKLANPALTNLPTFIGHGTHDGLIKAHFARETYESLTRDLGFTETTDDSPDGIEFHIYEGLDHHTSNEELGDVQAWLKRVIPA